MARFLWYLDHLSPNQLKKPKKDGPPSDQTFWIRSCRTCVKSPFKCAFAVIQWN